MSLQVPAWVWPWVAGLAAIAIELSFRLRPDLPYLRHWAIIPLALVVNYSIYRIYIAAPSFLAAFVSFSTATLLIRVAAAVLILGEPLTLRLALSVALAFAARRLA